jgi:inorganic triphosphatase YgiF
VGTEIEAKYRCTERIAPEQVERVALAPYQLGQRAFHPLRDSLLDTPDRALRRQNHTLRLRKDGARLFLTLKGARVSQGDTDIRPEWELEITEAVADNPDAWPAEIRERVRSLAGEAPLRVLFHVYNDRTTWDVYRDGKIVAEIALDRGTIHAGALEEAMHELEVEAKKGDREDIAAIVAPLVAALPLVPESRGKAARGFALLDQWESM